MGDDNSDRGPKERVGLAHRGGRDQILLRSPFVKRHRKMEAVYSKDARWIKAIAVIENKKIVGYDFE